MKRFSTFDWFFHSRLFHFLFFSRYSWSSKQAQCQCCNVEWQIFQSSSSSIFIRIYRQLVLKSCLMSSCCQQFSTYGKFSSSMAHLISVAYYNYQSVTKFQPTVGYNWWFWCIFTNHQVFKWQFFLLLFFYFDFLSIFLLLFLSVCSSTGICLWKRYEKECVKHFCHTSLYSFIAFLIWLSFSFFQPCKRL